MNTPPPRPPGMKRPYNYRTKLQRTADLALVEQYRLQGLQIEEIAELVSKANGHDITYSQVRNEICRLEKLYAEEARRRRPNEVSNMLRKLDKQEASLWEAWERSKLDSCVWIKERVQDEDGGWKLVKTKETYEGQCGNPQYMKLILEVHEKREKLLGLNAPVKHEVAGPGGGPMETRFSVEVVGVEPMKPAIEVPAKVITD